MAPIAPSPRTCCLARESGRTRVKHGSSQIMNESAQVNTGARKKGNVECVDCVHFVPAAFAGLQNTQLERFTITAVEPATGLIFTLRLHYIQSIFIYSLSLLTRF